MKKLKIYNKKHYQWQFSLFICFLIAIFIIFFDKSDLNLSNFILLATLFAILWYSLEARELRIATNKQLEPILLLYIDQESEQLRISNIGKTPAFNVIFDPVSMGDAVFEFNKLEPIYHIPAGENFEIKINKTVGSSSKWYIIQRMSEDMATEKVKVINLLLQYDSVFRIKEKIKFVFDISGYLKDEEDSARKYKIYPLL
jgi:hypothetical protein